MDFGVDSIEASFKEALPLIREHFEETGIHDGIEFDPDVEGYLGAESAGVLRVYSCRDDGLLVGYAVYVVSYNLHYKSSLQALQDVVFIRKQYRGVGFKFMKWCDDQLKIEGVGVVLQNSMVDHDISPLLIRMGYTLECNTYRRRL